MIYRELQVADGICLRCGVARPASSSDQMAARCLEAVNARSLFACGRVATRPALVHTAAHVHTAEQNHVAASGLFHKAVLAVAATGVPCLAALFQREVPSHAAATGPGRNFPWLWEMTDAHSVGLVRTEQQLLANL